MTVITNLPDASADSIRRSAFEAAEAQRPVTTNPFVEGTDEHNRWRLFFWQRERELNGEEYA